MRLSKARKEIVTTVMKDTIFEAAGSVLEQHGVGGMTMDRVAASAGLAAGSLYNYFRNKDDLMQFVYTRLVEPFFEAIEEICNSDLPAPQKLAKILQTACDSAIQHKGLIRFLAGKDQVGQIRRDTHPRSLRILTTIFEQGIREGSFRPHNAAHTGRMLQGCFSELFELQKDGASSDDMQGYVEALIDTVDRGFSLDAEKTSKPDEAALRSSNP